MAPPSTLITGAEVKPAQDEEKSNMQARAMNGRILLSLIETK
jgi:hypothetical protein